MSRWPMGRSAPPAGRAAIAWLLGLSGTVAAVRGWGGVVIYGPVQAHGLAWIAGLTAAWAAGAWVLRDRRGVVIASGPVLVVVCALAAWSSVGRQFGLVGAISVVVGMLAILPSPARPSACGPSLALVGVAQLDWAYRTEVASALVLLVLAVVAERADARWPQLVVRRRDARRALVDAGVRIVARVAAAATGVARGVGTAWQRLTRPVADWVSRRPYRWLLAVSTAVALGITAPIYYRFSSVPSSVLGTSDFETHLGRVAVTTIVPFSPGTPYPMYHLGVKLLAYVMSVPWASTVVLSLATVLTVLALDWLCRQPYAGRPPLPAWAGPAFVLAYYLGESPNVIAQALHVGNSFDWAPTLHMYLNPTDPMGFPFAVVQLVLLARSVAAVEVPSRREGLMVLAVTVLSPLAKPSLLVPLLVAAPAFALVSGTLSWARMRFLAWSFVAPSLVVFAWQTWYLSVGDNGIGRSSFGIDPFHTIRMAQLDRSGPLLLVGLLVLPLCLWASPRRFLAEPAVRLTGLLMAVSLPMMFLLTDTGRRTNDATFTKPAYISGALLLVVCWRFLLGEAVSDDRRSAGRWWANWRPVAALFAAAWLVAGVLADLDAAGVIHLPTRGSPR